jgi:osmotically-inducible protein OsmY
MSVPDASRVDFQNRAPKKLNIKVFLLLAALAASGCQTLTGRSAGRNIDDASITAAVKSTLVADKAANLTRIDVDTTNGVVSLSGIVSSAEHRDRAAQLAGRVDGVRNVINNLQVQSPRAGS